MKDWIVTDAEDNIVGKYRSHNSPRVPDELDVREVDDGSDYEVIDWWNEL